MLYLLSYEQKEKVGQWMFNLFMCAGPFFELFKLFFSFFLKKAKKFRPIREKKKQDQLRFTSVVTTRH